MLTKEAILGAHDLPRELVEVPEWDGEVYVRSLMGNERDEFEKVVAKAPGSDDQVDITGLKALLVAVCVAGEDGEPLFTVDDAKALNAKSAAAIDRLYQVAKRLNGMRSEDIDEMSGN